MASMGKVALLVGFSIVLTAATAVAKGKAKGKDDPVKRGAYLVTIAGCNDCHTPLMMGPDGPAPNMELMLSGHPEGQPDPEGTPGKNPLAVSGPDLTAWKFEFGIVYARNLTPDKTGLGDWTEEQFIKTMRTGRHQGDGRALLLPMPWPGFAIMSDADLKAIWAFLRTIKPIKNTVADPKVPPPVLEMFGKTNAKLAEQMAKMRAEAGY